MRRISADAAIQIGLLVFLALCCLGGGWNLPIAPGLILLRPIAIALIALCLVARPPIDRSLRLPMLLLAGLSLSMAVQLVPLPPSIWWQLPGRAALTDLLALGLDDGVWRPISLAPGVTWNSLLATLTAWAIVLAMARLPQERVRVLVEAIIAVTLASCFVGLLQLIGGENSAVYFYKSDASVSGLLANRNHQATLLALTLPLLRVWSLRADEQTRLQRGIIAMLGGGLILGMLFLTGSRSGLIGGVIGLVGAYTIGGRVRGARRNARTAIAVRWAIMLLPVLLLLLLALAGRDLSVQRVAQADYVGEIRWRSLPTVLALLWTYFPVGSGWGTFDIVFRMVEPDDLLKPTFFNRAHNDYLEVAITGGLLPTVLLAIAIAWSAWAGWRVVVQRSARESGVLEARAGLFALLILAAASLSDYPIRPPLMTALAAIAACWLARGAARGRSRRADQSGTGDTRI